jgi:hypothetical protein
MILRFLFWLFYRETDSWGLAYLNNKSRMLSEPTP